MFRDSHVALRAFCDMGFCFRVDYSIIVCKPEPLRRAKMSGRKPSAYPNIARLAAERFP
jgi:hypothetical protein